MRGSWCGSFKVETMEINDPINYLAFVDACRRRQKLTRDEMPNMVGNAVKQHDRDMCHVILFSLAAKCRQIAGNFVPANKNNNNNNFESRLLKFVAFFRITVSHL